jgi:epsilon-lactone hydrolase
VSPNPTTPPENWRSDLTVTSSRSDEDWNVFRIKPAEREPRRRVIYVHGGAFVWHMIESHWNFIGDMVDKTAAEVIIPAYPLAACAVAPERTANAALVLPKIAELLDILINESDKPTILMGDSAGANIATASLLLRRNGQKRLPDHTILISPWLDLSMPPEDLAGMNAPGMDIESLKRNAEVWRGPLSTKDQLVSPLNGPAHNLGRIAVFCGTADVVSPGCQRFAYKAGLAEGTDLYFRLDPGEPHSHVIVGTSIGMEARNELFDIITGYD